MELSEAKEVIKGIYRNTKFDDSKTRVALFTIMNYIEKESIPKEKIKEKIEMLYRLREDALEEEALADARDLKQKIDVLQELLGE